MTPDLTPDFIRRDGPRIKSELPMKKIYQISIMACLSLLGCRSDAVIGQWSERATRASVSTANLYDDPVPSLLQLPDRLDSLSHYRLAIRNIDPHSLSDSGRYYRRQLISRLDNEWRQLWAYRTDPSLYNLGGIVKSRLARTDQPLEDRLDDIAELLLQAGNYYAQAQQNLYDIQTDRLRLAVQKQLLGLQFLERDLMDSVRQAALPVVAWRAKIDDAAREIRSYLAFCQSAYLNMRDSTHYTRQEAKTIR